MRGSFFGLNVSVSGLFAAERNLDIVNHNVTNASTPGYSRQAGNQVASKAIPMYDGTGMYGTGTTVDSVVRIRDEFLDYKYWSESQSKGEWSTKDELLQEVEATFNEPTMNTSSSSGFSAVFNDFYSSLQDLSKSPGDEGLRAIVKQRGVTLASYFNTTATHFEELQDDLNYRVNTKVTEVNTLATQIRNLNKQIYTAEVGGNVANDLRDQRTVLVDNLSKIADIQANEVVVGKRPDGSNNIHFTVTLDGKNLVDHFNVSELKAVPRATKKNSQDIVNLYDIKWKDNGAAVDITGGELKGYMDIRDGNEGENSSPNVKGIPYYIKKLDEFVQTFAKSVNEIHEKGYGLDSNNGYDFFTMTGADGNPETSSTFKSDSNAYKNITAKTLCVSADILNDIKKISCASSADANKEDASVINNIIDVRHNTNLFGEGSAEDFMKALISNLGIDAQQAQTLSQTQEGIVSQVENERQAVSGVSLNEEMANMIKYQQCYSASARMINTMSTIYETLIDKLGV